MEAEKEENILVRVLAALESGKLVPTFHALEQMDDREITFSDVKEALYNGQREEQKDDYRQNPKSQKWSWRYSIRGLADDDRKDLRIVVALEDPKTFVITVIDLNRKE